MTKTFITTKGEYLLVEVPEEKSFKIIKGNILIETPTNGWGNIVDYGLYDCEIISLLKDITEQQAKEIMGLNFKYSFLGYKNHLPHFLQTHDIDTSLNWLLLKKI